MEPSPVPDMPEPLTYSTYSTTGDGHLVVDGGRYPSHSNGPGPTQWVSSDQVYSLDLNDYKVKKNSHMKNLSAGAN